MNSKLFLRNLLLTVFAIGLLVLRPAAQAQVGPGKAYRFTSANSQLELKTISIPPPWTVELWVKRGDSPSTSAPLFIDGVGALKLEQYGSGGRVGFTKFGAYDYHFSYIAPTSQWVHLAFVAAGSSLQLFTNGVLHEIISTNLALPLSYFGHTPTALNEQLVADLDELRIWQSARAAVEIRSTMNRRLTGSESNLLGYWQGEEPFDTYATSTATTQGPVRNGALTNVPRVPSGARFIPEVGFARFSAGQTNQVEFRGFVNPGNLPTDLHYRFGPSLSLTSVPPVALSTVTQSPIAFSRSLPLTPDGSTMFGQVIASNTVGMVTSAFARAWAPLLTPVGDVPLTNECHEPLSPPNVRARKPLIDIAAGWSQRAMIRADGVLTRWYDYYTIGSEAVESGVFTQVASSADAIAALRADGSIVVWGWEDSPQLHPPAHAMPAVAVACGRDHAVALTASGSVVAWGDNLWGQVNVPADVTNIIAIAAGYHHTLALNAAGRVFAWGSWLDGRLNNTPADANYVSIAAGERHSAALRRDGTVVTWGGSGETYYQVPQGLSNIVQIAAGGFQTMALRADGRVFLWGSDGFYFTHVPDAAHGATSIRCGVASAFAFLPTGDVVAWAALNWDGYQWTVSHDTISRITTGYEVIPSDGPTVYPDVPGPATAAFRITNEFGVFQRDYPAYVIDTRPPSLELVAGSPFHWYLNTPFLDPGVTAGDACDPFVQIITNGVVDVTRPGSYPLTYTATDASGNRTNVTRTVIVPPSAFAPGDVNADGVIDDRDLQFVASRVHGTGRLTSADLHSVLAQYYAGSPWLELTNTTGLGQSNVVFELLNGPSALGFQVEVSTNLSQWRLLGPATPRYEFLDTNAPASHPRFYRLQWQ